MNFLIAYGTTDGQTQEIARFMAARLGTAGHRVVVEDIRRLRTVDASAFDAVLVGGSLHGVGYQQRVSHFIMRNRSILRSRPSGFFSVCMAIASKDSASRDEARAIPVRFLEKLGWRPDALAVFAGALRFSRYGFIRGPVMRKIARKEMGDFDPHRDYVFTDWSKVEDFAVSFANLAADRQAAAVRDEHPAAP